MGSIYLDGEWECHTLEDVVREVEGEPVESWKVPGKTAIPSGRFRLTLEDSRRFGPDTITINDVPGFTHVRMHGGTDATDTEGCVLVGDTLDWDDEEISGALRCHVLDRLKDKIRAAISAGEECWISVRRT